MSNVRLAEVPRFALLTYALWLTTPAVLIFVIAAWQHRLTYWTPVIVLAPPFVFLGSYVAHARSRHALVLHDHALIHKAPNYWEFFGGVAVKRFNLACVKSCRAITLVSRTAPELAYSAIELVLHDAQVTADAVAPPKCLTIGEDSWRWSKEGLEFLESCKTDAGWLEWRQLHV